MTSTCRPVAPRQRSTATVSILRATNALTPLATPTPPSNSAMSPTIDRKSLSRSTARVSPCSASATVRARTFCFSRRDFTGSRKRAGATDAGSLSTASYSARLPKTRSCVSAR
jgi:hypothetical protein